MLGAWPALASAETRAAPRHIVVLDACRNNPFRDCPPRAGEAGPSFRALGRVGGAEVRQLVISSTALGGLADDGVKGQHSPFATAFLTMAAARPGASFYTLFEGMLPQVNAATGGRQRPEILMRGLGAPEGCLSGACDGGPKPEAPKPPLSKEAEAWSLMQSSASCNVLQSFIDEYPSGVYAKFARARHGELGCGQVAVAPAVKPAVGVYPPACDGVMVAVGLPGRGEEQCLTPGSGASFRDCPDCPEMVVVPSGSFMMGSSPDEIARLTKEHGDYFENEGPHHEVTIPAPFAVGKFEVTFAEWDACAEAGGCTYKPEASWGRGRQPVIDVSWDDITKEYLPWLSKKTGKTYRLLSESEWEYAARAEAQTRYSWGDQASHEQANYGQDDCCDGLAEGRDKWVNTAPVGQFPANNWGLHDLHGNVWEWTADCWNASYEAKGTALRSSGGAWTTGDCSRRVLRGGSWYINPFRLRSAFRLWLLSVFRFDYLGFRLARTL